jgi:hypothetical protein
LKVTDGDNSAMEEEEDGGRERSEKQKEKCVVALNVCLTTESGGVRHDSEHGRDCGVG